MTSLGPPSVTTSLSLTQLSNLTTPTPTPTPHTGAGYYAVLTVMTSVITLAVVGNVCNVLVIVRSAPLRHSLSNVFLVSLCTCDLLAACLVMPLAAATFAVGQWPFSREACSVAGFATSLFMFVSVTTLCVIAVERYYSIRLPMHHAAHLTLPKTVLAVLLVWLWSSMLAALPLVGLGAYDYRQYRYHCSFTWHEGGSHRAYVGLVASLCFLLPGAVLVVMYLGVFLVARKAATQVRPVPTHTMQGSITTAYNSGIPVRSSDHDLIFSHARAAELRWCHATSDNVDSSVLDINDHYCDHATVTTDSTTIGDCCNDPAMPTSGTIARDHCRNPQSTKSCGSVVHTSSTQGKDGTEGVHTSSAQRQGDTEGVHTSSAQGQYDTEGVHTSSAQGQGDTEERKDLSSTTADCRTHTDTDAHPHTHSYTGPHTHSYTGPHTHSYTGPHTHSYTGTHSHTDTDAHPAPCSASLEDSGIASQGEEGGGGGPGGGKGRGGGRTASSGAVTVRVKGGGQGDVTGSRGGHCKAAKTLLTLLTAYVLLWGPFFVLHVHGAIHQRVASPETTEFVALWLGFASFAANPFLYGWLNKAVRAELLALYRRLLCLCCCCCYCCPGQQHSQEDDLPLPLPDEDFMQFLQRTSGLPGDKENQGGGGGGGTGGRVHGRVELGHQHHHQQRQRQQQQQQQQQQAVRPDSSEINFESSGPF